MRMHNPPHPGEIVKSLLIEETDLTITEAAKHLDVTRGALSKLINCHSGISPEMAIRLSIAFNTSADMWLNLQNNYNLWEAEKKRKSIKRHVSRIRKSHFIHQKSA